MTGYHNETAMFIAFLAQNMPEIDDSLRRKLLSSPERTKCLLELAFAPLPEMVYWPEVWKTISLGGVVSGLDKLGFLVGLGHEAVADKFRALLQVANIDCHRSAHELMIKVDSVSIVKKEVDLVLTSPRELGFRRTVFYRKVFLVAEANGLELCTPEMGIKARLSYKDQPKDEMVVMGMEPVVTAASGCMAITAVFRLSHPEEGLMLSAGHLDHLEPDDKVVFALPPRK